MINMKDKYPALAVGTLLVLGVILIAVITAWPVQLLWNYCLVPAVTFAKLIGFWQAFGLNILASILFKTSFTSSKSNS